MSQTTAAEAKYILSPLNNRMLNYRVYYMNATEKIGSFLLTLTLGGLAGLVSVSYTHMTLPTNA